MHRSIPWGLRKLHGHMRLHEYTHVKFSGVGTSIYGGIWESVCGKSNLGIGQGLAWHTSCSLIRGWVQFFAPLGAFLDRGQSMFGSLKSVSRLFQ